MFHSQKNFSENLLLDVAILIGIIEIMDGIILISCPIMQTENSDKFF